MTMSARDLLKTLGRGLGEDGLRCLILASVGCNKDAKAAALELIEERGVREVFQILTADSMFEDELTPGQLLARVESEGTDWLKEPPRLKRIFQPRTITGE